MIFNVIKAIVFGLIEGITEWLPISSTGHLILAESFLHFQNVSEHFWDVFEVVIQLGAIMAVVVLYFKNIWPLKYKKEKHNINATLINPRFITGVDEKLLENLKQNHSLVITLEDGELDGGFGEKITRFYGDSSMKVLNFGALKEFTDRTPVEELYQRYHLNNEQIVEDIIQVMNKGDLQ